MKDYDAYDVGRVPFQVDIKAFFKIDKPNTAAKRVESFKEMKEQLTDILRGAIRSILASADIESILQERGEFGEMFTKEVTEQLKAWGVPTVKNIEFMDIRDSDGSMVIANIMAKKQSLIEKESRVEVAKNKKDAHMAEIDAVKETNVRQQEADLLVGQKKADKDKQVGIANETAKQEIREQARITAEKDMAVVKVQQEKQAEIDKNVAEIKAAQDKEIKRLAAEAALIEKEREADSIKVSAEANLFKQEKEATAIELTGTAKANAEKVMLMAPVDAQITLAKEIGNNEGYMEYLLGIEGLKAGIAVGIAKAEAISSGDLKIIANAGSPEGGVNSLMDMFSTSGGTQLGGMLEALQQTEAGKEILSAITRRLSNKKVVHRRVES